MYTICSTHSKVKLNKSKAHRDVGAVYTNDTETNLHILQQQQDLSSQMPFDFEMFGVFSYMYGHDFNPKLY